ILSGPGSAPADSDSLTAGPRQPSTELGTARGSTISSTVSKFSRCGIGRSGAPVNSNASGIVSTRDALEATSFGMIARGGPGKPPAAASPETLGEKIAAPLQAGALAPA